MIRILAGMAKSGKSIIAHVIVKRYPIRLISTDWIMMMLHHTGFDQKIDVTQSDISVSRAMRPYLDGLIKALVDMKKDTLIEGVHIQPDFAEELMTRYPDQVQVVFLGYKDKDPKQKAEELKKHMDDIENPWYAHMDDQELLGLTQYLHKESLKLYQTCLSHGQTYIEVDDIEQEMDEIIRMVMS